MNIIETDNVTLYPEQALAALNRLETALETARPGAQVDQALRFVPGKRAVFLGRDWPASEGRDVVFRIYLEEGNDNEPAREWDEMNRAWDMVAKPPYRVAEPYFFDAETRVLGQEYVTGTPLLKHMWGLDREDRAPHMTALAEWFHWYTAPSLEWRDMNLHKWKKKAAEAAATQTHPELQAIESRVLRKMNQLSRRLKGEQGREALCHADYHANNLILGPRGLTGIDLGGKRRMPIYKDIARVLTHMSRRGHFAGEDRRFGVDALAYQAFVEAFEMTELEATAILPFWICFETLIKVEHPQMPAHRVRHGVKLAKTLFRDLRDN